MISRLFSGVVIAGRDRVAGARIAHDQFGLDVLILDDGFQHRRLKRDVDLLLFSGRQGRQSRRLLPAGPLREPLSAANRADIFLLTKSSAKTNRSALVAELRAVSQQQPLYYGRLEPVALVYSEQRQWRELPLTTLSSHRIAALTGIADPLPFYQTLQEWDAEVAEVLEFPDHHQYAQTDWQQISALGQKVEFIVTTEKDLVKLERYPFATRKLVALRVRMVIERENLLLADIEQRLAKAA
jgi:tetraacyldisaccharide 4'-kinase